MDPTTTLLTAQRRLSMVWLLGGLLLLVVVAAQAGAGVWRDDTAQPEKIDHTVGVFQWLFSNIIPTITLILVVLAAVETRPALKARFQRERRSTFFYRLTLGIAVFYLAAVLAFPALASTHDGARARIQLLTYAGFILPVLQGLATTVMGVFFFKVEEPPAKEPAGSDATAKEKEEGSPPKAAGS